MDRYIRVNWHHGGSFVRQPGLKYVGGFVAVTTMDCDKLSLPELMWYIKDFGYTDADAVYYKPNGGDEFILLNSDRVLLEVSHSFKDIDNVDLYVSHIINTPILSQQPAKDEVEEHPNAVDEEFSKSDFVLGNLSSSDSDDVNSNVSDI